MARWTRRTLLSLGAASLAAPAQLLLPDESQAAAGGEPSSDLASLTLAEASARIQSGTVTSSALTHAVLDRIAALNPKLNCYITVLAPEAIAEAAERDSERKAGRLRGPLHGIPIALKDNIDTAGVRTTAASPMFKDRVPTEDAEIVRRLKEAGVVLLGKLNLHEFAFGCTGDVSYFGPTRNPWALDHVTGGSSSGSGAAVSAALAYGALGTDTGGSIRVPSAWCGIVGLKPTVGLVSIRGIIPCAASLDHCGPMARRVEDVALMLGAMAGYDPQDIFSVPSAPQDYLAEMRQPVSGFRLGAPQSFYDHIAPDIEPVVMEAVAQMERLTRGVVSRAPLWDGDPGGAPGDAAFYHHDLIERYGMDYMPPTRARVARWEATGASARAPTAAEDAREHQRLMTTRRLIDRAFQNFDLVVVPTTRLAAPTINSSLAREMRDARSIDTPDKEAKVYDFFASDLGCANTHPFDSFGIPALSLPCGFTKAGLPVGLMIAGPHFSEGKVLALAHAYQEATAWHARAPVLSASMPVPPIIEATPGKGEKDADKTA